MFSHRSHHHPPNHNVFLGSTLTVSRYTEQPTQLQCTPCRLYRRVNLTTTHQVTMYPSDLLSLFWGTTNDPLSHNLFLVCSLANLTTTRQITMYSLDLLLLFRGTPNNLLNCNVPLVGSVAMPISLLATKSQCIPQICSHCFEIWCATHSVAVYPSGFTHHADLATTHQVIMYFLAQLLLLFWDWTNDPLSHKVFPAGSLATSISLPLTEPQRIPWIYSHCFGIRWTTHLVTMHSL